MKGLEEKKKIVIKLSGPNKYLGSIVYSFVFIMIQQWFLTFEVNEETNWNL